MHFFSRILGRHCCRHSIIVTVNVSVSIKACFYLRTNMYRQRTTSFFFLTGTVTGSMKVQGSGMIQVPQRKYERNNLFKTFDLFRDLFRKIQPNFSCRFGWRLTILLGPLQQPNFVPDGNSEQLAHTDPIYP